MMSVHDSMIQKNHCFCPKGIMTIMLPLCNVHDTLPVLTNQDVMKD